MIIIAAIIVQIYLIIKLVDNTNIELSKFILSIKHSDSSQSFPMNKLGGSFRELGSAFTQVMNQINEVRSEKEENFQYLQTVVKHIGIGLISFTENGKIEIINDAAKKLLDVNDIINIKSLLVISPELVNTLENINAGEKTLIPLNQNGNEKQISIYASEFKLRTNKYKLVSLQDIKNELERERLAGELEIAHRVQIRLLPLNEPSIKNYIIKGMCISAREVGGDYYDYINLGNNKLGVVIGDVSGKGLKAAFYMTMTKGIFQSQVESSYSPGEVLKKVNRLLIQTMEKGSFVTMFYGILDYDENSFTYARAGHEPGIYYNKPANKIEILRPAGIGLGLKEGIVFEKNIEDKKIYLNKGDLILLYTDGFNDARNKDNEDYGRERIIKFIERHKNIPGDKFIKALSDDVSEFSEDSPQFDDLTLVTINFNPY
ncbi:MAG TPA: SpoIIE family protein phosphatase [Ignavibacteriaceae bacterium]|nr:SpoIIE family protein phosphatase [Ignavibacteriaceae bacterium]